MEELLGSKLPSNGEVMRNFLYHHRVLKKVENEAADAVIGETLEFWRRARIPTMAEKNAKRKLLALHKKWWDLQKGKKRKGRAQEAREMEFKLANDNLFDIASADALERMLVEKDKEFLTAQRQPGRQGSMAGIDKKLADKEKKRSAREKDSCSRQERETERAQEHAATAELASSPSSTSSKGSTPDRLSADEGAVAGCSSPDPKKRRTGLRPVSVVSPELATALDRTKVSNRAATHIVLAAASSLGHDTNTLAINRESIHLGRIQHRAAIAQEIRNSFLPDTPFQPIGTERLYRT
jgi:hypothetical protein